MQYVHDPLSLPSPLTHVSPLSLNGLRLKNSMSHRQVDYSKSVTHVEHLTLKWMFTVTWRQVVEGG